MDFADMEDIRLHKAIDDGELEEAEHGERERLARKVRKGHMLTDDERRFVSDFLEGKRKQKRGNSSVPCYLDAYVLEAFVYRTEFLNEPIRTVTEEIAGQIGESVRNVYKRMKRVEGHKGKRTVERILGFMRLGEVVRASIPEDQQDELGEQQLVLDRLSRTQIDVLKKLPIKKYT